MPLPQNHKEDTQCTSADSNTGWALCFAIAAACVTVGGYFNSVTQGYVIFNALVFALLGLSFGRWPHDFKSGSHKVEKLIIVIITVVSILHLVFYAVLRELARH